MNGLKSTNNEIAEFENIYSPRTILGVYANAIRSATDGRIILTRGVYQISNSNMLYAGYFYDSLKNTNGNEIIKAKIPTILRGQLDTNSTYVFKGYIEKKINSSSIELVFVVDDILQKEENQISEEEIRRYELLQKKASKGFRDFEAIVKEHIYKDTTLKIANLYGNTAIVHKDFEGGIADALIRFEITDHRCNFASKADLINLIRKLKSLDFDVIAIVRGGGDQPSLEVFNDSELCTETIGMSPVLVTALGHTVNDTLMDKIADKKFALPHDYGIKLKVWVDQAVEEQAKSKSIFIQQVKEDLTKTFTDQIQTLHKQLEIKNKEFETAQLKFKEMIDQNHKDKKETILTKEKAFEEQLKAVTEQMKSKDESIIAIKGSLEQQISSAIAEGKTKYQIVNADRERLIKEVEDARKVRGNIMLFIVLAIIAGLIIGLLF